MQARATTPRILYLSPFWPRRATSASELRALHIGRALQQFAEVEVVVVGDEERTDVETGGESGQSHAAYHVSVQPCPNRGFIHKVNWALNSHSVCPHGVAADQATFERVVRSAKQFDMTWFFKLRTANMFPCWAWPRSVVDVDDVPSTFERSLLTTQQTNRERLSTSLRLWSWKRRERLLGRRFGTIAVCSDSDRRYLQDLGVNVPVHVVPNGYERPTETQVRRLAKPPRIGFIGVLDHVPNLEGIRWFARDCWPRIKRDISDAHLRLVGRFSDGPLKPLGVDIDGLGWIQNPADEMSTWSAMIVPVHVGAGTRGKIAHAFSQRCPVVSTSLGAYGYDARDGHDMLVAESAESFADACVHTIREPAAAAAMADRAWQGFLEKWTWDAITPHVWAAAEDCLRSK